MPSAKHSASMRDSPRLGRSQDDASPPSTPTGRRLDTLEASQAPSTVLNHSLDDTLGTLQIPAGSAPGESGGDTREQQSEPGVTQQNAEVKAAVEQQQQKASGLSNRHLSEEDDQEEEDDADESDASDTDDEEDSDEEDEADRAAGDSWQVLCCSSCSTFADACNACHLRACVPVFIAFCKVCEALQLSCGCIAALDSTPPLAAMRPSLLQ